MKRIITGAGMLLMGVLAVSADDRYPTMQPGIRAVRSGVAGSKHDFSVLMGSDTTSCDVCHIPHILAVQPTTRPTTRPSVTLVRVSGQRRVFAPDRFTPGPASLVCLGCHDGTVATSVLGSAHAILSRSRDGFAAPEGFSWQDHPIGVPYPTNRRDFRPQGFVTADGKIRLPDGYIECVSCHDPHNEFGIDKMLVKSNRRSALCLACHIK